MTYRLKIGILYRTIVHTIKVFSVKICFSMGSVNDNRRTSLMLKFLNVNLSRKEKEYIDHF